MNEDRSQLRLWTMSAVIALILHGGLVIAALRWHQAEEPLMIDLSPLPPESSPDQSSAEPGPGSERSVQPTLAERTDANGAPQERTEAADHTIEPRIATSGKADTEPAELPLGLPTPQASGPSEIFEPKNTAGNAAARDSAVALRPLLGTGHSGAAYNPAVNANPAGNNPVSLSPVINNPLANHPVASNAVANNAATHSPIINSPAANSTTARGPLINSPVDSGAAGHSPITNDPVVNSPIDTSITVQPGPSGRGLSALEHGPASMAISQKGGVLFRPARLGEREHAPGLVLPGVTGTRPAGAHVQDRAKAAAARYTSAIGDTIAAKDGAKAAGSVLTNALGTMEVGVSSKGGTNAGSMTTNAIGIAVRPPEKVTATTNAEHSTNSVALESPATPAINGRNMIRPGSSTTVIGGPPRRMTGAISGTNFPGKVP
jgi:hypothetical protein